jgi:cell division protein FtsQ
MYRSEFNRKKFILSLLVILLLAAAGTWFYVTTQYAVTEVEVEGNTHYTDDEIKEMILPGGVLDNSLYLALKYRNKEMKDIPFVETMDVEIVSNHKIQINVYEKALAGCISYLGSFMYFDREGIVVESSDTLTDGVPQIKGLSFDHVILNEKLPVEDESVFSDILKVTQLLAKYEIQADKIFFGSEHDITLYYGMAKVLLGTDEHIDEKIMQLVYILPNIEGKSGTLDMRNFDDTTTNITFTLD